MKLVYFEPAWYVRVLDSFLLQNPPPGYQFVVQSNPWEGLVRKARRPITYHIYQQLGRVVPLNLAKAWLERWRPPPRGTALTYAYFHLVFRSEPWVLEILCDQPYLLIGSERQAHTYRSLLSRRLRSPLCKAIICRAEAVKGALLEMLGDDGIEEKTEIVYGAAPARTIAKHRPRDKIRLLFVNSAHLNFPETFYGKGGLILLEAFRRLLARYGNLELVIRSKVPPEISRERPELLRGVRIIEDTLPWEELEREWLEADIFVMPSYVTPDATLIEAMSYQLPVVTTDVWATPEIVADGRTGFLISAPSLRRLTDGHIVHFDSHHWVRHIKSTDMQLIEGLEEKLRLLIENEGVRRRMGEAGYHEVEHGKFSIQTRNEKLKRIFDEATGEKS